MKNMNVIEKAIELILENGGDFEGPKDLELIEKAELYLKINFPPSYKQFLSKLGCGDIEGQEFYGIINDDFENSCIPDAVWLTMSERQQGLSEDLIIIGASGYGTYFALDTSKKNDAGENPVIEYMSGCETRYIADSFGEFLLSEINSVLEIEIGQTPLKDK